MEEALDLSLDRILNECTDCGCTNIHCRKLSNSTNFPFKAALKIPFIDKLLSGEGYNFAHTEIIDGYEMGTLIKDFSEKYFIRYCFPNFFAQVYLSPLA